jgi:uncharacterized membrane protein
MVTTVQNFVRSYRQAVIVGALTLSTLLAIVLYGTRVARTHSIEYSFLVWNIMLAWLPMLFALAAYNAHKHFPRGGWFLTLPSALIWLLFMPNAPYIVTDIVNLQYLPHILYWYDVVMFAAYAWTGVFLGLISLFLMQEIVRKTAGRIVSWVFVLSVLGLSSFGVYLGRFLRWNSWDAFFNPWALLAEIAETLRHPISNSQPYIFSIVFTVFILSTYLMMMAVMNLRHEALEN